MPRKNPLLKEPLKNLLAYKGFRGSYNPAWMYEALRTRSDKEIKRLTPEEQEEHLEFIAIAREEMEEGWLRRFFETWQDRPFKAGDFAAWLAENVDFSSAIDLASTHNFACELVAYAVVIVVSFANKGFIERVPSATHNTYRVAVIDNNPLIDDPRKIERKDTS